MHRITIDLDQNEVDMIYDFMKFGIDDAAWFDELVSLTQTIYKALLEGNHDD